MPKQKKSLQQRKLEAEVAKAERENEPDSFWAKLAKTAGIIVAIVGVPIAIYNLWDPIYKIASGRSEERRKTLQEAVALTHSDSANKALAVDKLSQLLNDSDSHTRQTALTEFTHFIATESDPQIQSDIRTAFEQPTTSKSISASEWLSFQRQLAEASRVVVKSGDLHRNRQSLFPEAKVTSEEQTAEYIRDMIVRNILAKVVPDFTDYHGIYCVACKFQGYSFAHKANFSGAILDTADFSKADLAEANFDNAEIAGSSFAETNLPDASFRSVGDPRRAPYPVSTLYVEHAAASLETNARIILTMPDFSCANLRAAHFDGHTLFAAPFYAPLRIYNPAQQKTLPKWWATRLPFCSDTPEPSACQISAFLQIPPKFYKADLSDAHLENVEFLSIQYLFSPVLSLTHNSTAAEFNLSQGVLKDTVWAVEPAPDFQKPNPDWSALGRYLFQKGIRASLYEAQYAASSFPKPMAEFLTKSPPSAEDYRTTFLSPFGKPQGFDPDANCTPRRSAK